jgi:hypothetical protein
MKVWSNSIWAVSFFVLELRRSAMFVVAASAFTELRQEFNVARQRVKHFTPTE